MKLDYRRTFLLGLGFLGVSVIWSIYTTFVPLFLSQRFHLSPATITFFISLDNVAALLIQPPVGVWSDKIRTPIGRRMPFILFGAPIAALAFAFIPVAPVLPLFVACSSTLLISMAVWRTPVVALVADVTPSPLRSQASGIVSFMGGIGAAIAYIGGAKLATYNRAYPFWLGSIVVFVAALVLVIWVKEPKTYESETPKIDTAQPGLWDSLVTVYHDASAFRVLLATFFLMVGYTAVEGVFSLYALHHLGYDGSVSSRLLGQASLIFLIFALPSGNLGAKFGRKPTVMIGIAGMAALLLAMFLTPVPILRNNLFTLPVLGVIQLVGLFLMLIGLCWTLIIIHLMPMLSDMAENSQLGTYTGLYYLVTSLAAIVGLNLNGLVAQWCGGNYNMVMLVAPIALGIAFVMMLGIEKGEMKPSQQSSTSQMPPPTDPILDGAI